VDDTQANAAGGADEDRADGLPLDAPVDDDRAMEAALVLAGEAGAAGEVPVGAVVVVDGRIVAARRNEREATGDPTAHAEVLALRDAAAALGDRRLRDATLVVTLEPCPLCAGAVWAAQVGRVVYGAADLRSGAMGSLYSFAADPRLNHTTDVRSGLRAEEAAGLLTSFFAARR
jgi:tRNA(adenine34) deaminase